jgi:hypothetical protein
MLVYRLQELGDMCLLVLGKARSVQVDLWLSGPKRQVLLVSLEILRSRLELQVMAHQGLFRFKVELLLALADSVETSCSVLESVKLFLQDTWK